MKTILRLKRIYLLVLLPISYILILLARKNSYFAEKIFLRYIYKPVSQVISIIAGIFPFSLAEIIIICFPVLLIFLFVRFLVCLKKLKGKRKETVLRGITNFLCLISVLLFLFTVLAGVNYYRYPFSYYSNLEIQDSTVGELYDMTQHLARKADELRELIPKSSSDGVFELSENNYKLAALANKAMKSLSEEYPILGGSYSSPKPVLLSALMSNTEITGFFFPFTMEANVNVDIPDYNIPVTMLHELAHIRGFMREDEANYIAYLAGMESDSVELQYSSTMLALIISGNALYDQDPELYFKVRDLYSKGVRKDIMANSEYWVKYEDTVVSTLSNKVNDTYLKANAQTDGVKSYGRMLDLLLAKYRKDHLD